MSSIVSSPRTGREAPGSPGILADSYLSQLLSYSLDTFHKEPQSLRNQQEQLGREIADAAVSHYKGFINAATSFSDISKYVEDVHQQLHALVLDTKQLHSKCNAFASHAKAIQEKRKQTRSLLLQHATILELLEVPQLIDTCVRNGNYDEALDLMAFMNKVTFAHSDVPMVQHLLKEVKDCSRLLLEQLLARLSGNVMLPESLRSVSYIRRLAAFSELELRRRFLQCRETWLQSVVDGLNDSNPADFIRQLTDVYRLHIFDIVMQYRAIFSESDPAAAKGAGSALESSSSGVPMVQSTSAARVLYGWAQLRVQLYVDTVERHFPRIQDGNSLAAVMEACMYCGGSLSRVGLDFRGLLLPVFTSTVLRVFEQGTGRAVVTFASMLENHRWVHMPLAQRRAPEGPPEGPAPEDLSSAYLLLEHPPLAVFANGMIAALNSIRSVAMLCVSGAAAELMRAAVHHACGMLAHHGSVRKFSEPEVAVHSHACKAMCDVVCPLLASLFRQVFSPTATQPDFQDSVALLQSSAQDAAPSPRVASAQRAAPGALRSAALPGSDAPRSVSVPPPAAPPNVGGTPPAGHIAQSASIDSAPRAAGAASVPSPAPSASQPVAAPVQHAQAVASRPVEGASSSQAPAGESSSSAAAQGALPAAKPVAAAAAVVPVASGGSDGDGFVGFGASDDDSDGDDAAPDGW